MKMIPQVVGDWPELWDELVCVCVGGGGGGGRKGYTYIFASDKDKLNSLRKRFKTCSATQCHII